MPLLKAAVDLAAAPTVAVSYVLRIQARVAIGLMCVCVCVCGGGLWMGVWGSMDLDGVGVPPLRDTHRMRALTQGSRDKVGGGTQ
jgi:hypothetical protein